MKYTTKKELTTAICAFLENHKKTESSMEFNNHPHILDIYVRWNCGFSADVCLDVQIVQDANEKTTFTIVSKISWSSTHRNIAQATAAVALYNKAIQLASMLECTFN